MYSTIYKVPRNRKAEKNRLKYEVSGSLHSFKDDAKPLVQMHDNYLCTNDLYSPVHNVLPACISIMRGSGRGLGPAILEFFGPCEMVTSR
jgi:hypothetical protein